MKIFASYHAVSFCLILSVIFFCLNANAQQPGFLDTSFADKGILISENFSGICTNLALQKSGKVIGAWATSDPGNIVIARYNDDGSLDKSFNDSGFIYTVLEGFALINSITILADDKILVAGIYSQPPQNINVLLARYLPDGKPDSSFGENGIVTTDWGADAYYARMAVQSDGKIIVTGNYIKNENDIQRTFLVRYLPNGSVDESFGDKGLLITKYSSILQVSCIVVQPDDKILVGTTGDYVTVSAYFQVARYLPDGKLDEDFGNKGITQGIYSGYANILYAMALQQDGKIITAGGGSNSKISGFGLIRFETNGNIDEAFGDKGLVITPFDTSGSFIRALAIQKDGKIIAAGQRFRVVPSYYNFALARYKADGLLDSLFGINGTQFTEAEDNYVASTTVIQNDGKIILGGGGGQTPQDFVLARYIGGDGVLSVKYASITAKQNKNTILLNWQTTSENNNTFFAVEHAANNKDFTEISRINSKGSSSIVQQYSYTDKQPGAGNNYYRLKQVNTNGQYSYSKTVAVNFIPAGIITLHPNPANDIITIEGMSSESTSIISLFDMQGKMLLRKNIKAAVCNISVSNFSPGIYMVKVQDGNNITVLKFEKK